MDAQSSLINVYSLPFTFSFSHGGQFLKILEMRVIPIAIADPPLLNIAGLHTPYALKTVIERVGDDGHRGGWARAECHDKRKGRRRRE